ncbi:MULTISPECIES: helix-turn-helix domain-containing protein [Limosilactobacillus]|uniref:Cro/Cl family transcriptional regulator n=2 Tax=Limosilactobacillus reuteri TaxID=1598 RepID=S5N5P1_LIMRT|nr:MULTISPECIES: helix-turn-helix transcriptional regulator [Limosilactobacillus]AGR64361.1 Cro/Cl family transcriptional regulator [Limosilactobacillus reuteri TD1]MCC4358508.1 helix-turn-helix domain-containing protein [Limosilactobacillus reuteri]MCC4363173.1 helix-turn-helix domain-containing protein [Limosilactobacillus reuteri]MCC4365013.1 helix-turn-helix domain-containing protein [Limosilactobacillus reuteri]MCD7133000.1 helix-turn-helix domain-containing protein [Limosilactobacillus b
MSDDILRNNIIRLREERGWSQAELARRINMNNTALNKVEKGVRKLSSSELDELASVFNVSTDYLLGRSDKEKEPYYELTDKEKNDIAIQAEKLMEGIESGDNLNFYGEPATEEQKERLLIAVQTAMEMNKRKAKKKFTPKKYRN